MFQRNLYYLEKAFCKMEKMSIAVIMGTRPEAIKLAPLILEMRKDSFFTTHIISTGQHREMMLPILDFFKIEPDFDLSLMNPGQTLSDLLAKALMGLSQVFCHKLSKKPEALVVQGDTLTAMAAGLFGFLEKIPVAHVEAGLRTGNLQSPWPEEFNRRTLTLAAQWHFAPTEKNRHEIMGEHIPSDKIFVVGNTVIDALRIVSEKLQSQPVKTDFSEGFTKRILLTIHRRESFGEAIFRILMALKNVLIKHSDLEVLWPIHKNPEVRKSFDKVFGSEIPRNLKVVEPLDYISFVQAMMSCDFILTDSGGVQEEAPFLGKPVLVLRESTERQESVNCGSCRLIGSDESYLISSIEELMLKEELFRKMSRPQFPYGRGDSAKQIVQVLKSSWKPFSG